MFYSLWRYVSRLILRPMADEQEPLYFLVGRPQEFGPTEFYRAVTNVFADRSQYNITKLEWYKQPPQTSVSEHEFLVAELKRNAARGGDLIYYAVIERTPDRN